MQTWEGRQFTKMQSYPVAYFKKIKEYCDKNGIELICVTSPITPSSVKRLGLDVVNEKFEKFFGELGVTYYNFNKARMDVLPREDNDYADKEGHMEGHLAEEYSQVLGEVIDKHIDGTLNMKDYFMILLKNFLRLRRNKNVTDINSVLCFFDSRASGILYSAC